MLLKAQKYDITVEHIPGKEMHIADHVPRSHLRTTYGGEYFEMINMVSYLPIRREKDTTSHEERQSNERTNRDKCCTVTS